ncbi:MAG: hypothetical protein WCQ70_11310 [Lentimicrobiaceae bacterium]
MIKIFTFAFLLLSISTFAQNLVINPSFEDSIVVNTIRPFSSKGWLDDVAYSSVDLFSAANFEDSGYAVPNTYLGFHHAYDGDSFIGLLLFSWSGNLEHITGSLSSPMLKDSLYQISFHIKYPGDSCMIYSKFIEVLFSGTKPKSKFGEPFFERCFSEKCPVADLKINIEETVTNKDWVKCQAVYKAKGNEKYFTLGIFYQNKDFFKLSKKYNSTLLDYKKQSKFLRNTELFPVFINKNQHVDLTNKSYAYRFNIATAYYFIDDVFIEPYHP